MLTLTANDVRLGATASDWQDALQQAARDLERAGRTSPEYLAGMNAREQQSSTVLGNGIAIPHGTPESRDAVLETGVRILQFPEGVTWHDGARVNVLVAIAAQSDEHLDILRHLTRYWISQDWLRSLAMLRMPRNWLPCFPKLRPLPNATARRSVWE